MNELTAEQRMNGWRILHQVLVLLDDWLCDSFEFNRKAKGKYLRSEYLPRDWCDDSRRVDVRTDN